MIDTEVIVEGKEREWEERMTEVKEGKRRGESSDKHRRTVLGRSLTSSPVLQK